MQQNNFNKMISLFLIILLLLYITYISSLKESRILKSIISRDQSLNLFKSSQPNKQESVVPEISKDFFVQYLPSNKKYNAIHNKNLIDYGKIMNAPTITTSCRRGECRKCEVMIDNKVVLGCKVKIPTIEKFPQSKIFQVIIPTEPGKKGKARKSFD